MNTSGGLKVCALGASTAFGGAIAQALGISLTRIEERTFEDGEYKIRPLDVVSGSDFYVIQSLHAGPVQSADEKLNRLLFLVAALKDAGAASVTAVAPYLCYARKDRRTKWQDPVSLRYVASLFEAVGTNAVAAMDVHNEAAFENAFRCRTIALTAAPLFVDYIKRLGENALSVVSPDPGGVKRAERLREALEAACGFAVAKGFVDKHRSGGVVTGDLFVGDVAGRTAIIVDDLISSGGTLVRAARALRAHGAARVIAAVTHGLFMTGAPEAVMDPAIDRLVVTDCVPAFRILPEHPSSRKIDVLSCVPLCAEAIRRLHEDRDLRDLFVV